MNARNECSEMPCLLLLTVEPDELLRHVNTRQKWSELNLLKTSQDERKLNKLKCQFVHLVQSVQLCKATELRFPIQFSLFTLYVPLCADW